MTHFYRKLKINSGATIFAEQEQPEDPNKELVKIRSIWYDDIRADALANLAPQLTDDWMEEALEIATEINDEAFRGFALGKLAAHISDQRFDGILSAAQAIGSYSIRAKTLASIAYRLPAVSQHTLLYEVLFIASQIDHKPTLASVLIEVTPYLLTEQLTKLLEIVQEIESDSVRAKVIKGIIVYLSENLIDQAMTIVSEIADLSIRINTLSILSNYVEIWYKSNPYGAYNTFCETILTLSQYPRPQFLDDLAALMPFILALAGDEAPQAAEGIYQAIQEVCEWWP